MSSIDRILTALHGVLDALTRARPYVRTAAEKADDGLRRSESLGIRGTAERFARVGHGAERVEAMLAASVELARHAIGQAEAARQGRVAGDPPADAPSVSPLNPAPVPVAPEWRQPSEAPEHVRAAGTRLRPRVAGERRPTVGVWQDELIHSGGRDASIAADVDHDPMSRPPVALWQHVESKVAARMRRGRLRHAEVIMDNTVCGSNPHDIDYPWGANVSCRRSCPPGVGWSCG
jgi:nucleic acid/nucleotide deaminase of polymorphic system toxin